MDTWASKPSNLCLDFLPPYEVRSASKADREVIRNLIDNHEYYHHHLDWQSPLDWLDQQPFLICGMKAGILQLLPALPVHLESGGSACLPP